METEQDNYDLHAEGLQEEVESEVSRPEQWEAPRPITRHEAPEEAAEDRVNYYRDNDLLILKSLPLPSIRPAIRVLAVRTEAPIPNRPALRSRSVGCAGE